MIRGLRVLLGVLATLLMVGCGGPFGWGWGRADIPAHHAAWAGDCAEIKRLRDTHAALDDQALIPAGVMNSIELRPLDLAAYGRRWNAYAALVGCGVTPGPEHLAWAVGPEPSWDASWHRTGAIEYASRLLNDGVDPNAPAQRGPPLVIAAGHAKPEAVALLLRHGADPNLALPDGTTPLIAASLQNRACTEALLNAGGSAHALNTAGQNALFQGPTWRNNFLRYDPDVVALLVASGADPNQVDSEGCTPLTTYLSGPVAEALIARGADPRYVSRDGRTMLHRIAEKYEPSPGAIRRYVTLGVDVNATDRKGRTALDIAVEQSLSVGPSVEPTLMELLEAGASPDLPRERPESSTIARARRALAKARQAAEAEAASGGNPANRTISDVRYTIGNSHASEISNAEAVVRALTPYSHVAPATPTPANGHD